MKQTAVEYLLEKYKSQNTLLFAEDFEQAKEMEKQQIINCFDHGDLVGRASLVREINPHDKVALKYPEISAEEYYNKTFKSE